MTDKILKELPEINEASAEAIVSFFAGQAKEGK